MVSQIKIKLRRAGWPVEGILHGCHDIELVQVDLQSIMKGSRSNIEVTSCNEWPAMSTYMMGKLLEQLQICLDHTDGGDEVHGVEDYDSQGR